MSESVLHNYISDSLQREQPQAFAKFAAASANLQQDFSRKQFFYLFAICPRWFKKGTTSLALPESLDHFSVSSGWQPSQFARLLVLLDLAGWVSESEYKKIVNELFDTADVNELILLVQSLAFLPNKRAFVDRAREAARSNIVSVFNAVAHQSDFACEYFDQSGWNQLILKAAFLAVPIWNITGLLQRNNPELVTMLKNYIWERQAASRDVPWDIWRCIAASAKDEGEFAYLRTQFSQLDQVSQGAIVLALSENTNTAAQHLASELHINGAPENWQALSKLTLYQN